MTIKKKIEFILYILNKSDKRLCGPFRHTGS